LFASESGNFDNLTKRGFTLMNEGKPQEAVVLLQRALEIRQKRVGSNHVSATAALNNLAIAYSGMGDYAKSLEYFKKTVPIWEKAKGPAHPTTIAALNNVATAYLDLREYTKAKELYERVLAEYEKKLGKKHELVAKVLWNLADTHRSLGDYAKALTLMERAVAIREALLGRRHVDTFHALSSLAAIYQNIGDYNKALDIYERIQLSTDNADHPVLANTLNNIGNVQLQMGNLTKAVELNMQALEMRKRSFGPDHIVTAGSLNDVGIAYLCLGDEQRALNYFNEALEVTRKVYGQETARTTELENIALTLTKVGNYDAALPQYKNALAIAESSNDHRSVTRILASLARLQYLRGELPQAMSYADRAIREENQELQVILSLDERSRLAWQYRSNPFWWASFVDVSQLVELSLRRKAVVVDSLIEDRVFAYAAARSAEGRRNMDEIGNLRSKLAKLTAANGPQPDIAVALDRIAQLERSMADRLLASEKARRSTAVDLENVSSELAGRTVLLDFLAFTDPKISWGSNAQYEAAKCYGVLIIAANHPPIFVRIDGATVVDDAISALRYAINENDGVTVEQQMKFLSEKLWQPIAAQLPRDTKRLFISPDAKLNFLSFGTLLESDGSFVAERYPVAYIGSGRDLARKPSGEAAKTLAVFADPLFDASGKASSAKEMVAMRSAEADVFGTINLPPLPGTKAEAEQLVVIAAGAGWNVKAATGEEATEASVRGANKPGVLHLATHGFYLNSFSPPAEDGTRGMSVAGLNEENKKQNKNGVDPMRASGVALARAQQTLKLWSQRKAPDPETDGILTAEEVASLNLDGTWLVTLSACETGVGEARSGEGVIGLRRAFMMAGAENLLMTLWPVADDTTAQIMADFYKEALATGDAPGSLAKVQRDWLVKLRDEKGLAAAIREAGPFAMVMMTAPTHPPVELPVIAKTEPASEPAAVSTEQPSGDASTPPKNSGWWPF
jgi:tetratricopeptide (TPR) repeat protein